LSLAGDVMPCSVPAAVHGVEPDWGACTPVAWLVASPGRPGHCAARALADSSRSACSSVHLSGLPL